jgi:hypothetical protein
MSSVVDRFPVIELSYETAVHKKVYIPAVVIAIPFGVKHYLWITFDTEGHACYSLELNRVKKIVGITKLATADWYSRYAHGTVLYGTWSNNIFVTEDIYYYRGLYLRGANTATRLKYLYDIFSDIRVDNIRLAQTFLIHSESDIQGYRSKIEISSGLAIHHLQVRHTESLAPYLNIVLDRSGNVHAAFMSGGISGGTSVISGTNGTSNVISDSGTSGMSYIGSGTNGTSNGTSNIPENRTPDFRRPQYRIPTVFAVRADIQPDIYFLFTSENEYFGVAYIPSYQKSIYMNRLFRRIRENDCIESAEDSEDESDFENTSPSKFVELSKTLYMECIWSPKFKKWVPVSVKEGSAAVSMQALVTETGNRMDIKNAGGTSKSANGTTHRGREKYPTKVAGGVGGLCGQYQRNSRGETQFSSTRRYPENGRFAQKIREPARVSTR